jgi:hypothetical protein
MKRVFFNTTKLAGGDLLQERRNSKSQTNLILDFFKSHPDKQLTPFEVADVLNLGCPITSIRRSLTVLTDRGCLNKCDTMKEGMYGKKNYTWQLKKTILTDNSGQILLTF